MDRITTDPQAALRFTELLQDVIDARTVNTMMLDQPQVATREPLRPVDNVRTSRRVLTSKFGSTYKGVPIEQLVRETVSLANEEEILRAAKILAEPARPLPPNTLPGGTRIPPSIPAAPSAAPSAASKLGRVLLNPQIAIFLEALLHSGELNTGEGRALAEKRKQSPTIDR